MALEPTPTLLPDMRFHDLVFGHELGAGAFSTVRYARHIAKGKTRSAWSEYAVKVVDTGKVAAQGYERCVAREIAVLRLLGHPGIARMVSAFRWREGAYLVLEYAAKGDLHTHLVAAGSLDEPSARFVVGEVLAALRSVHDAGYVCACVCVCVKEREREREREMERERERVRCVCVLELWAWTTDCRHPPRGLIPPFSSIRTM